MTPLAHTSGAQADLSGAARLSDKLDRGRAVYEALTAVAHATQAPLRALLDARGATYRAYWVTNMLWVRVATAVSAS